MHKLRTASSVDADDETSDCNSAAGNCSSDSIELEEANELNNAPLLPVRIAGSLAEAAAKNRGDVVKKRAILRIQKGFWPKRFDRNM